VEIKIVEGEYGNKRMNELNKFFFMVLTHSLPFIPFFNQFVN